MNLYTAQTLVLRRPLKGSGYRLIWLPHRLYAR